MVCSLIFLLHFMVAIVVTTLVVLPIPRQPLDDILVKAWHKVPIDVNADLDSAVPKVLLDVGRTLPGFEQL
jgi:hypothetical protein